MREQLHSDDQLVLLELEATLDRLAGLHRSGTDLLPVLAADVGLDGFSAAQLVEVVLIAPSPPILAALSCASLSAMLNVAPAFAPPPAPPLGAPNKPAKASAPPLAALETGLVWTAGDVGRVEAGEMEGARGEDER